MSGYSQILAEDQRYSLLRVLSEDAGYSHNEAILQRALEGVGHSISQDALHNQLSWLAEQGLIELSESAGLKIAKLTPRGLDVAKHRTTVPGVARPLPGY